MLQDIYVRRVYRIYVVFGILNYEICNYYKLAGFKYLNN